jgi:protein-tyrosine phosphatase
MTGYFDIHAHVLPGIDDGPSQIDDAVAMLRAAAGCGIATIVATPHVRSDFPGVDVHELAGRCAEMRARLADEAIVLELAGGAEVALVWAIDASEEELRLASYGQRGTDLLIETPLTTNTLLGDARRSPTCRLGVRLCNEGLVHALASDSHRAESWRPVTRLPEAVAAAAALLGPERARWMAVDAPAAILQGAELPEAPPIVAKRRQTRLWGRR